MNEKLKELDVLAKYLDENELKEIAKQVAYDSIKSYVEKDSKHRNANLRYFADRGAMLALREEIEPIKKELLESYKKRVKTAINKIDTWEIRSDDSFIELFQEAISHHKKAIEIKTNEIVNKYVNDETEFGNFYGKMIDVIGESFTDLLNTLLEQKFKQND